MKINKSIIIRILVIIELIAIVLIIAYIVNKNKVEQEEKIENFSIVYNQEIDIPLKEIIIRNGEVSDIDYNVYVYKGNVFINLNNDSQELTKDSILLRDAILDYKITMDKIMSKITSDYEENKIVGEMYKDGGSMIYKYDNYTIIKCNTLDGNKDMYIGPKGMTLTDLNI